MITEQTVKKLMELLPNGAKKYLGLPEPHVPIEKTGKTSTELNLKNNWFNKNINPLHKASPSITTNKQKGFTNRFNKGGHILKMAAGAAAAIPFVGIGAAEGALATAAVATTAITAAMSYLGYKNAPVINALVQESIQRGQNKLEDIIRDVFSTGVATKAIRQEDLEALTHIATDSNVLSLAKAAYDESRGFKPVILDSNKSGYTINGIGYSSALDALTAYMDNNPEVRHELTRWLATHPTVPAVSTAVNVKIPDIDVDAIRRLGNTAMPSNTSTFRGNLVRTLSSGTPLEIPWDSPSEAPAQAPTGGAATTGGGGTPQPENNNSQRRKRQVRPKKQKKLEEPPGKDNIWTRLLHPKLGPQNIYDDFAHGRILPGAVKTYAWLNLLDRSPYLTYPLGNENPRPIHEYIQDWGVKKDLDNYFDETYGSK